MRNNATRFDIDQPQRDFAELERIDHKERKSAAGRKPMDRVVMFKMLILQNLYGLSDEALEYQVSDRLTRV